MPKEQSPVRKQMRNIMENKEAMLHKPLVDAMAAVCMVVEDYFAESICKNQALEESMSEVLEELDAQCDIKEGG